MECRHRTGASHGGWAQSRHRVDQHLWLHRRSAALGRFRRVRPGARTWRCSDREFYAAESGLVGTRLISKKIYWHSSLTSANKPLSPFTLTGVLPVIRVL